MANEKSLLNRRDVVSRILHDRGDALVITSLGNPTFDVAAAGDCAQNFYLWGAMGGAVMVGMGVALAQPQRRVIVFVGDGEMMMGLGSLATVAVHGVRNLSVVVLDNEHYAETGMQLAHAGRGVDITAIAKAAGFAESRVVRTEQELEAAVDVVLGTSGPVLVTVKVGTEPTPTALPPRDGPYLRSRFREALLGADAHK
ncbi:aldehyde dehydrogenase [Verminephrobacter aporrectodeae subsp. tuberculatae]|uniref:thiamine pyrophosphate-dependent enzyme n=1 Tax=Verminephrobacter aporrectodeae TaxID=1110389 RepID=UPI00223736B8|nr:thiamine pyrophosphate-dependent enzyme [Verminephrobacter aporrectodeae]MCW5220440.1 aldehyde dehydrogenase [Verminephrobacter aporrectodeae subsp. tuberculatae]MCW5255605.1 aldehyde dehydrogenase [Verminephrobacter aporrectodeae subsp. tuberculatae]MCW5289736.1 aldehyde dehydrogenase [Verminephrobacter aporrectodeae subsp. tuberculatae]MCW8165958.1 aldehyde dehydrogenase [Verminephrobacter aporrectodeae subsp. tuberculatae]MCW8169982.1 aldehyde dehydrogenase [Verminephrobacter aporrectode